MRSVFRQIGHRVHASSGVRISQRAIERRVQLGAFVRVEIVAQHGHVDLCPFGEVGGFVKDQSPILHSCLEGLHIADLTVPRRRRPDEKAGRNSAVGKRSLG